MESDGTALSSCGQFVLRLRLACWAGLSARPDATEHGPKGRAQCRGAVGPELR